MRIFSEIITELKQKFLNLPVPETQPSPLFHLGPGPWFMMITSITSILFQDVGAKKRGLRILY